jgi:hypothetical protein
MSADERLAEVAEILARGIVRLKARRVASLCRDYGESCLDFTPDLRGHVAPNPNMGAAE